MREECFYRLILGRLSAICDQMHGRRRELSNLHATFSGLMMSKHNMSLGYSMGVSYGVSPSQKYELTLSCYISRTLKPNAIGNEVINMHSLEYELELRKEFNLYGVTAIVPYLL